MCHVTRVNSGTKPTKIQSGPVLAILMDLVVSVVVDIIRTLTMKVAMKPCQLVNRQHSYLRVSPGGSRAKLAECEVRFGKRLAKSLNRRGWAATSLCAAKSGNFAVPRRPPDHRRPECHER